MNANTIVMFFITAGFVVGGIDKITGNHLGLGQKFEEGIGFFSIYVFSMAGLWCLVPVAANLFRSVFGSGPVLGVDPSFLGGILGIGMGGYGLAVELANTPIIGTFCGIIVGSMLGATLTFTIPVGFNIIKGKDREYYSKGLMMGLIPIPIGCFIGGKMMGIGTGMLIQNEMPVLVLAGLLIIGLKFFPEKMSLIFAGVSKVISFIAMVGLLMAGITYLSGFAVNKDLDGLIPTLGMISGMCVLMAGSLPIMELIMRYGKNGLAALGKRVGLNAETVSGILFSVISVVPPITLVKDMNPKGKIVCTAFMVSSTCAIGGQLSNVLTFSPENMMAMLAAKLSSATIAAILAAIVFKNEE